MSQGADPDEIGLMNIDEQLPVLEYPQPGLDIIQVHTHTWTHTLNRVCEQLFSLTVIFIMHNGFF